MKSKHISLTLTAALALGLASCSKNEPVTPATADVNKAADSTAAETAKAEAAKAAEAAKVEAAKAAEAAKVEAAKATEAAKVEAAKVEAAKAEAAKAEAAKVEAAKAEAAKAEAAKAADNGKILELIEKAKTLIAENKFSDAASVLQQLSGQTLTSDQTKLVDGLKEQIQKALAAKAAGNAAGSVGDLLKK